FSRDWSSDVWLFRSEVPLDEGNAAVGIDGQQAAGTGAVVFPADDGGGQPPFPLQTHTTVRQLFVGVFPAVPEQAQQGVAVTLAAQMLVEPLAQRLQLGRGTVQRGIGQTVEPGRQWLGSSLIAVEVPQLLHVADQQVEARIARQVIDQGVQVILRRAASGEVVQYQTAPGAWPAACTGRADIGQRSE